MKINAAFNFFRGNSASGLRGQKAGSSSSPWAGRAQSDQVALSKQVLAVVQMQNRIRALEQATENARNSPEAKALESMRKAMKVRKACNRIAARIRAGDQVPLKDLRYLLKNDPHGYQLAMAARKPKEDPKKWESAIPKEEKKDKQPADYPGRDTGCVQAASGGECSSGTLSGGETGSC